MKHKILIVLCLVAIAMVTLTSCEKRCRCVKYDSSSDFYTPEQIKAAGKSCDEMRYLDGLMTPRYSLCQWEY